MIFKIRSHLIRKFSTYPINMCAKVRLITMSHSKVKVGGIANGTPLIHNSKRVLARQWRICFALSKILLCFRIFFVVVVTKCNVLLEQEPMKEIWTLTICPTSVRGSASWLTCTERTQVMKRMTTSTQQRPSRGVESAGVTPRSLSGHRVARPMAWRIKTASRLFFVTSKRTPQVFNAAVFVYFVVTVDSLLTSHRFNRPCLVRF